MSGSQVLCVVCHAVKLGFKFFSDCGWACETCVKTADHVVTTYRIGGIRFIEVLKRPSKKKAPSVEAKSA